MRVQDIYIYPIKSLGGIRVKEAVLREKGFEHDRRFMLVDEQGHFLSQRKHPQMALLQTQLTDDGITVFRKDNTSERVEVPFEPVSDTTISVTIWEDRVEARLVDEEISCWFSDLLNMKTNLVFMPENARRELKAKYAVKNETVSFADGMPYLLISQASLDDLNSRLDQPVPMDRFRPNIVISGATAFQEDEWDVVQMGDARFKITKPCARCVMTTVDQKLGTKGKEPLTTLASYRKVDGSVLFGQNMLLLDGKKLRVGDSLQF